MNRRSEPGAATTKRPLRIAIATNGRFHVLDLARELAALGHEVRFYSMLPGRRVEAFGLARANARSLFATLAPFAAWERWAPGVAPGLRERATFKALNLSVIARLEPCDLFIGMSGLILEAARHAREKFGALIYLERGSEHVLTQRQLLQAAGLKGPSDASIERELAGYRLADRIVIPARHVADSFAQHAAPPPLLINPYGVDLAMFPQRTARRDGPPTIAYVGGWRRSKGVDLLVAAMRRLPEAQLIHAGMISDVPFPNEPRFRTLGFVDQSRLAQVYAQADVQVLASRAEGLPLVRIQALACGLPIVASAMTGADDLRLSPALSERIDEVPQEDVSALAAAIGRRLDLRAQWTPLAEADRQLLSWRAYGGRYARQIETDLARRPPVRC